MPLLDVSFVVNDPMLADAFVVRRYAETVDTGGRAGQVLQETFDPVIGVVTRESPDELMRTPDLSTVPSRIFVASMFAFRGPSRDADLPATWPGDVISYLGTDYTVVKTQPYSQYGGGTHQCVAESQRAADLPPE